MLPTIDVFAPVKIGGSQKPAVGHISPIIFPISIGEFLRVIVANQKVTIGTFIKFSPLPEKIGEVLPKVRPAH